jgi:hypothetical protein
MLNSTRRSFLVGGACAASFFPLRASEAKMIEPITNSEKLMYATARIVGPLAADSSRARVGTGFFYNFPSANDQSLPALVTNKHVIAGVTHTDFLVHIAPTPSNKKPTDNHTLRAPIDQWVPHPDANVDLCALPIQPTASALSARGTHPFYVPLSSALIPSQQQLEGLDAVEDILMVGYPNGLWDAKNNYPLIRRGITASHPAIDFDVEGVATTVVDIACFVGSSGSPVFAYNSGAFLDKKGHFTVGGRLMFLGVLFSAPFVETDGKIVIKQIPTVQQLVPQTPQMMNLGYIIKARELEKLGAAILTKHGLPVPRQG